MELSLSCRISVGAGEGVNLNINHSQRQACSLGTNSTMGIGSPWFCRRMTGINYRHPSPVPCWWWQVLGGSISAAPLGEKAGFWRSGRSPRCWLSATPGHQFTETQDSRPRSRQRAQRSNPAWPCSRRWAPSCCSGGRNGRLGRAPIFWCCRPQATHPKV